METILLGIRDFLTTNLQLILRVLLIIVLAYVGMRLTSIASRRIEKGIIAKHTDLERQARLKTLLRAGASLTKVVIFSTAVLMLLTTFGINIVPILASVGVAGLAISLGAQTLFKDYLGGALILLEDTYQVGELIEVGGVLGTVEKIELRTTQMRDFTGKLITIPNGDIRTLANTSRGWSRAVVDINLGVETDLSEAVTVLQKAAEQAAQDEALKLLLLEAPQIQGWSNLSEWAIQVRITAKTLPGKQTDAAIILRRVTLEALQAAGISLAAPPIRAMPPAVK